MTFAERSDVPSAIERVFRAEYGKVIATLIGTLRDFDLAEEALQDAFTVALERWPRDGIPPNPAAWLATTAKRKADSATTDSASYSPAAIRRCSWRRRWR
jgi:predicted RNA polymerase sigma factor